MANRMMQIGLMTALATGAGLPMVDGPLQYQIKGDINANRMSRVTKRSRRRERGKQRKAVSRG